MLFFNTTEDMQIVPYLDYDKQGLFADRKFAEKHYIPLYKDKMYVSDYRHALFLMVNDVKNNNMMGRINTYQTINIPEGLQLPIDLSSRQDFIPLTKRLKPSGKAKIALLGGFGPAYGDNICGVTAYRILEEELLKYFSEIQIDIYHVQSHKFSEYYNRYGITIYQEPLELSQMCEYDYYFDITAINVIPGYHQRSIVDSFLWMFSIPAEDIPKDRKRNNYVLQESIVVEQINRLADGRKKVYFNPESIQDCRNAPIDKAASMVNAIIDNTDYVVFTIADLGINHPRLINVKNISSSFDDFANILSCMDRVVTVDTVAYHLTDSFDVPTLVIFTNAGIGRISDYPDADGYVVDQLFLDELEDIRSVAERKEQEYEFLNLEMPSVWEELDNQKIIDFLLATE